MSEDLLSSVVRAAVGVPQNRLDLLAKLASKMSNESSEGQAWHDHFSGVLKTGLPYVQAPKKVSKSVAYLEPLYVGEKIIIRPADGKRTIAQAKDVFVSGIDPDFVNWGLDVLAKPTEAMECIVFEQVNNCTFAEVFGSTPLEQLCCTQHQIIDFCVTHKDKLRQDECRTFFLFQVGGKFFVAYVSVLADGHLDVAVRRFSRGRVWLAEYRYRFVIPQLAPVTV